MASKFSSWWKKNQKPRTFIAIIIIVLLLTFALAIYLYGWDWTGFTSEAGPTLKPNEQYRPPKTLWDVLQLLIVPTILAIGGFWLNQRQKSREEETERRRRDLERKMDLMRRVRAVEIKIMTARELLNAHLSAKTYSEQFAQLRLAYAEVEEILEDLNASQGLFKGKQSILIELRKVIDYLQEGKKEYIKFHNTVISDKRATYPGENVNLRTVVKSVEIGKQRMEWTENFMDIDKTEGKCQEECFKRLKSVMTIMRTEVVGPKEYSAQDLLPFDS